MGQISAKPVVVAPKEVEKSAIKNEKIEVKQQPKQDDHYENLDQIGEEQDNAMSPNPITSDSSSQDKLDTKPPLFKLPQDTKSKADPFSARYDTLRMMPDVQWDKPLSNQQQLPNDKKSSPTPIAKKS